MYYKSNKSYEKFCPYRFGQNSSECLGYACAAWRWKPELNPDWRPRDILMESNDADYRRATPPYIESKTHGYCGMATRPNFHND